MAGKHKKLKALMITHGYDNPFMAKHLKLSASTFSRKLNGKAEFVEGEINDTMTLFKKSYEEIFLD